MKALFSSLLLLSACFSSAQAPARSLQQATAPANERLGTVSFPVSCVPASQPAFNRGLALLHDFWYEEAKAQFERLTVSDPHCAMAHWGLAISGFHQIWDRPGADTIKFGWAEIQKAQALPAGTPRERDYIAALAEFYRPGPALYPARIAAYSAALGTLSSRYPDDPDTGAFYVLSLLASALPNDTTLGQEHKAMAVLAPLFQKFPDNPGVDHYITHACDNPAMAAEGLSAANHYGELAASGPHAFHMPGHIYARLGMWPQDIASQLGSIAASQAAEAHGEAGMMDEPHSYDFLLYAYLQSGQDKHAKALLDRMPAMLAALPSGAGHGMDGMQPYYQTKYAAFYSLEMRDWNAAAALEPVPGSSPEVASIVYWARAIADGHLHHSEQAHADLARYDALIEAVKKGKNAYIAEGTGAKYIHNELLGWTAFAQGNQPEALARMREAADLQDKVGQGEVDIPAREMLADMLLESGHPQQALLEYKTALKLSPNRLNGLYNAGRAAQAAGDHSAAASYYSALLKTTDNGQDSTRPEFAQARRFLASPQVAQEDK